jgi:hypothetical protein
MDNRDYQELIHDIELLTEEVDTGYLIYPSKQKMGEKYIKYAHKVVERYTDKYKDKCKYWNSPATILKKSGTREPFVYFSDLYKVYANYLSKLLELKRRIDFEKKQTERKEIFKRIIKEIKDPETIVKVKEFETIVFSTLSYYEKKESIKTILSWSYTKDDKTVETVIHLISAIQI